MALFVHVTSERLAKRIERSGIRAAATRWAEAREGVFALPVIPNFYMSHQWVRELKRQGERQMMGVYFRIPDDTRVGMGHYNRPHQWVTAAEAVSIMMQTQDARGYEVVIPDSVPANAIHRIRPLPHVGWRFFPNSHNRRPCACPICLQRGEIKRKRIWKKYGS